MNQNKITLCAFGFDFISNLFIFPQVFSCVEWNVTHVFLSTLSSVRKYYLPQKDIFSLLPEEEKNESGENDIYELNFLKLTDYD